jgi:hypothetical protein
MTDILIRDVPEATMRNIDRAAATARVSRSEFLRRYLGKLAPSEAECTPEDLRRASSLTQDLSDPAVMERAWQ